MRQLIAARLREPSTWAGIGSVITSAATAIATRDPQAIAATIAGVLAVLLRERAK
ncbi:hypothetical protein [Roseateles violae]|uniref:Uncharacterized protein n=1 Tax=Roseateles violae TaxID=3058042 RepID=A0ABT8E0G5_9BURK|nr:hypothetical protein [Pelomonas sp. PFR6]MDN3923320.1 hypothetical protein [Pelomonas sp. PFR6]MDN3923327.1 hypothetical protein [Pelomonas sp. PFR6]